LGVLLIHGRMPGVLGRDDLRIELDKVGLELPVITVELAGRFGDPAEFSEISRSRWVGDVVLAVSASGCEVSFGSSHTLLEAQRVLDLVAQGQVADAPSSCRNLTGRSPHLDESCATASPLTTVVPLALTVSTAMVTVAPAEAVSTDFTASRVVNVSPGNTGDLKRTP